MFLPSTDIERKFFDDLAASENFVAAATAANAVVVTADAILTALWVFAEF